MTVNILTAVELTEDADHFWTPVLELLAMTLIQNEHAPDVWPVTTRSCCSSPRFRCREAVVPVAHCELAPGDRSRCTSWPVCAPDESLPAIARETETQIASAGLQGARSLPGVVGAATASGSTCCASWLSSAPGGAISGGLKAEAFPLAARLAASFGVVLRVPEAMVAMVRRRRRADIGM